jgi:acyl-coenzyme A synthetase/AMP-(fatty) acid ligase
VTDMLLLLDPANNQLLTQEELLKLSSDYDNKNIPLSVYGNLKELVIQVFRTLSQGRNINLVDFDLSASEKMVLQNEFAEDRKEPKFLTQNPEYEKWVFSDDADFTLYTSGTTGLPKKVTQPFSNLKRSIKISEKHKGDVWALAFNPTHMAGLQVLLQALANQNTIINVFGLEVAVIPHEINKHKVSHISATPTFYRLLPSDVSCPHVEKVTSGGEKLDASLLSKLKVQFPNAEIYNIYASTEAGSVMVAKGENFQVKTELSQLVAVFDDELHLHKSLLGKFGSDVYLRDGTWYPTSDLVQVLCEEPLTVKFLQRKNEMINVGGYKVNPQEVEEVIQQYPGVRMCKVYGKKNSILGNVLICDLVWDHDEGFEEAKLRNWLESHLQPFKIPRMYEIVEKLSLTATGKLQRKI